ncbi:unnamed protein product, partial [Polarella glacialis]
MAGACQDPQDLASEGPDMPVLLGMERSYRQHRCLKSALSSPGLAAERCLLISQLFHSADLAEYKEDHALFFQNLRFADDVHEAAEEMTAGVLQKAPYVAVHLRPRLLQIVGFNSSIIDRALLSELRYSMRQFGKWYAGSRISGPGQSKSWPAAMFLATSDIQAPLARRMAELARGLGMLVVTSEDTYQIAENSSGSAERKHRHAALDVLLCSRAASFLGAGLSTMSYLIAALRRMGGGGQGVPSRSWPIHPSLELAYLDVELFPLDPRRPGVAEQKSLVGFFRKLRARIAGVPNWSRILACAKAKGIIRGSELDPQVSLPRGSNGGRWFHSWLRDNMLWKGIGPRLKPMDMMAMWTKCLWSCPAVAMLVNLNWLSAHLNVTVPEALRPAGWAAPAELHEIGFLPWDTATVMEEQSFFVQRLWKLLWTGAMGLDQLAAPEIRSSVLALLDGIAVLLETLMSARTGDKHAPELPKTW